MSLIGLHLRDVPKHVRILLVLQFLMNLSTFVAMPLMAVHMVQNLDLSAAVIGTVFTIHLALGRALPIVTGPIADRFGFRNLMVLGLIIRACGFLAFSFAAAPAVVILATFTIGIGNAFYESALYGIFGRQPDKLVTRVFILNNLALNLGVIIGPTLGTALLLFDEILPFRIAAVLFVLLSIWTIRFGYLDSLYASRSPMAESWRSVATDRTFVWFLATTVPWWFLFAQLFVSFPLYATKLTGLETSANAVFITNGISGLLFVAVSLFAFKWIKLRLMMTLCYLLLAAIYCATPASPTLLWFLIIVFFYTMAETLILPAVETITADLAPDGRQSTYFGALGLAWGLGAAMGSYAGSWLILEVDAPLIIWGSFAAVGMLGIVLSTLFMRGHRAEQRRAAHIVQKR